MEESRETRRVRLEGATATGGLDRHTSTATEETTPDLCTLAGFIDFHASFSTVLGEIILSSGKPLGGGLAGLLILELSFRPCVGTSAILSRAGAPLLETGTGTDEGLYDMTPSRGPIVCEREVAGCRDGWI